MYYQFASLTKNRVIIAIQSYFRNRQVPFGSRYGLFSNFWFRFLAKLSVPVRVSGSRVPESNTKALLLDKTTKRGEGILDSFFSSSTKKVHRVCMYLQLLYLALLFNEGNVVQVVVYVREHEPRWPQQLSDYVRQ